jgi:hypothetical protein
VPSVPIGTGISFSPLPISYGRNILLMGAYTDESYDAPHLANAPITISLDLMYGALNPFGDRPVLSFTALNDLSIMSSRSSSVIGIPDISPVMSS